MKIAASVSLALLQEHERVNDANVKLGGYGLKEFCPLDEFAIFRATLAASDIDRLFLLSDFVAHTVGQSGRLRDVLPEIAANSRVARALSRNVDLRSEPALAIVAVTADAASAPFTIIDGNNRAIAQFLRYGDVEGMPVFACVHERIDRWGFIPPLARARQATTGKE